MAIIGAGPAGLAAARVAMSLNKPCVVIDDGPRPGGQIWRHRAGEYLPKESWNYIGAIDWKGVRYLSRSTVVGVQGDTTVGFSLMIDGPDWMTTVHASSIVLATGARERFLPFPGWTLPGVVGIGGLQALAKTGVDFRGKRVAIAGSGALILPVAAYLSKSGAKLVTVAEQAPQSRVTRLALGLVGSPGLMMKAASYRAAFAGTRYRNGTWIVRVEGDGRVEEAVLTNGRREWRIACDWLACGFGLVPNVEIPSLMGCEIRNGAVKVDGEQRTSVAGVFAAGEVAGVAGSDTAVTEGFIAAHYALGHKPAPAAISERRRGRAHGRRLDETFALRPELRHLAGSDTVVCRCEDVRLGAIDSRWTPRQAKLYTRAGMGPCQGRVCGAALEFIHGWDRDRVRPPVQPAKVSTLADER